MVRALLLAIGVLVLTALVAPLFPLGIYIVAMAGGDALARYDPGSRRETG